jgi:acyl-CoA thioesterase II
MVAGSFFDHLERRLAAGRLAVEAIDDPQTGTLALWCRIPGHEIGSAATQAFVADIIPLAVCAALGSMPGGTSLDNTVRIIDPEPSEWVLLDIVPEGIPSLDRPRLAAHLESGRPTPRNGAADLHHPHQPPRALTLHRRCGARRAS